MVVGFLCVVTKCFVVCLLAFLLFDDFGCLLFLVLLCLVSLCLLDRNAL